LTPNELLANGYKVPGYVHSSDKPFIPGELPEDLQDVIESGRRDGKESHEVVSATVPVAPITRPVVVDEQGRRRRGNVRGEEGWVETPEAKGQPPNGEYPVLAIDCEMVRTVIVPRLTTASF
jgi:RNA exonuclease 1